MRLRRWVLCSIASIAVVGFAYAPPARANGAAPSEATPAQKEQAQARFAHGKELFAKRSFDEALAEFLASHDIVASPNTRLQMGRCLRAMGKFVAAYAEFGRTVTEAKELGGSDNRYKLANDAAMIERGELDPLLGFVSLTITNPADGTRVTVGGEEIARAAWSEPAPAAAGVTEIVVETPGHAPVKSSITLTQGAKTSLAIDAQSGAALAEPAAAAPPPPAPPPPPPPAPPPPSTSIPLRTWAYVAGGVGAGGLVVFAVSGLLAHSTYSDLEGACSSGPCPPSKAGEISSGKTEQTVANVGLVLGILGVGAGAALFVISMPKSSPTPAVTAIVSPGWIGVRGSL
ncbi:MAG: hypothetical protein ACLP1X_23415 [Polyangiaceae bacterium]